MRLASAAGHSTGFTEISVRVNPQIIQGPDITIRFGIIWAGKLHVVPEAVIDKMQIYPTPKNVKEC